MTTSFSCINTVTGTANQIDATPGSLNPVFAISNNPIFPGTGGSTVPTGTTAQRAGGPGTIRYNSTLNQIEATIDGITWSPIQGTQASSASVQVYISPTGSDITGTGSQQFPFATYEAARIYAAPLATVNNQYVIRPIGIFNIIGNITLSPFVNIDGLDNETSQLLATGQVLLDSVAFAAAANSKCHIKSVKIEAGGNYALTFTAFQNSIIHFDDVAFGATASITFTGSSVNVNPEICLIEHSITLATGGPNVVFNNVLGAVVSSNVGNISFINSSAITNTICILSSLIPLTGNILLQTSAAGTQTAIFQNIFQIGSTLTLDGTLMTLFIDSSSYSVTPTFLNGATLANITISSLSDGVINSNFIPVNYTPTATIVFKADSVTGNLAGIDAALGLVVPTGALNTVLLGQGVGIPSVYSTATYPPTTTINELLYSSAANTITGLATANNGLLVTSAAGVPSILAGPGTTGNILQSNAAAPPSFSTATYPSTTTINRILFSTAANVVGELATANSATLVTTSAGVPVMSATMTDGQVIIGSTGATPVANTLTAGAGIGIAVGAGTITITNTGVNAASNNFSAARLTLTTGVPVTTADVTAATNVYVTPYKGNNVSLFTAGAWQDYLFAEVTSAIPAAANTAYDVFIYDTGGAVLGLDLTAWTNLTTRATALATQDGVYVKTGNLERRYVGSFRTTAVAGQTEDSYANRFCWNYYNRIKKPMKAFSATVSWNYTSTNWRQANASTALQLNFFIGVAEDMTNARLTAVATAASGSNITVGIGLNSTTNPYVQATVGQQSTNQTITMYSEYEGYQAVGNNFLAWLESGNTGGTFYGVGSGTQLCQSGIMGSILC